MSIFNNSQMSMALDMHSGKLVLELFISNWSFTIARMEMVSWPEASEFEIHSR